MRRRVDGTTTTIFEIPKGLPVRVKVSGKGFLRDETLETESGISRIVSVRRSGAGKTEANAVSSFDWSARALTSSFKDDSELGRAYGEKAWTTVVITPEISEQAEKITQGLSDVQLSPN